MLRCDKHSLLTLGVTTDESSENQHRMFTWLYYCLVLASVYYMSL